ncbi:hypothetical protein [Thermoleptolyngbya sp. C42_A2020_037]|uniref:hypothetical protein n=1 Tax=Thermoleptolyngbya sp. C42_A2020_037 TaxID=2747799 RepID=UPI0019F47AAC|nr:hypothetical protein [Thermoleptolyngbya sp. C42_A2020_037]MBF2086944.1 hypothetical protein [Thermoleptolyngbya sp. C42_A2020_037]
MGRLNGAIAIQGSLILAQGLGNPSLFQRAMQQLPQELLRSIPTWDHLRDFWAAVIQLSNSIQDCAVGS